jgi:Cd2+/Zn2+-exporting ATPase
MTTAEPTPLSACTLPVERRGGRGEAGARSLERRLLDAPGVRDADVSFRTGTARIAYDGSVTSVGELRRVVRDSGVALRDDAGGDGDAGRSNLRVEAAFVALTFAGTVVGLASGWVGAPASVRWVAYGVA